MAIIIKTEYEIELMRKAGEILAQTHEELKKIIKPGISTYEIDKCGEDYIRSRGCEPSFLNYQGYPASICVSVNDEVVHGIPSKERILQEGDIVSLDAGVIYKGYHSDAARTYGVGAIDEESKQLMPGMVIAIEPMINIGSYEVGWMNDDWTVVTMDGSRSAHYENTVLITEGDPEILSCAEGIEL